MNKYDYGTSVVCTNKDIKEFNLNHDYMDLATIGNFDDFTELDYTDFQKWLNTKQNIVSTNEELAHTMDANYRQGYNAGYSQGKVGTKILIGAVIIATPIIIRGVFKIINHVHEIKARNKYYKDITKK